MFKPRPDAIVTMRRLLGISQYQLAARVGTTQTFIYRIEKGYAQLSRDTLYKLSDALNVPPELLVVREC